MSDSTIKATLTRAELRAAAEGAERYPPGFADQWICDPLGGYWRLSDLPVSSIREYG